MTQLAHRKNHDVDAALYRRISAKGHVGLVVFGALASGLLLGVFLVLVAFAGGTETEIIGAALVALGSGFVFLALGSSRFTDQPQRWALIPGIASAVVGLAVWVLSPGEHTLALAGWVWPLALLVLVVWSFCGARGTLHNWSRRALLYPALLVLLLVAAGGVYETVVEATSSNQPPAGRTYLVNGHSLYLNCVGHGSPTVVLFNGLGERTPSWAWVQRSVSASTRVCAFDRAGEGWSGGTPGARDGRRLSSDLHGLLAAAHVPGPYVLAGHSVGGIYALLYAAQYPRQVAGLALIDSATPYQFDLPDYPSFYRMFRRASAVLPSLARAGLMRLSTSTGNAGLPPQARDEARAFAASPRELTADHVDFAQLPGLLDEAKAFKSLGGKPLVVVTATVGEQRGWFAAQNRLAKLSTDSVHLTVPDATHESLLEDRGFARTASHAVTRVAQAVRSGRR
jgi:pimeloyl-ACP methyl ester carboxylesterase